jgi:hypothetical protein
MQTKKKQILMGEMQDQTNLKNGNYKRRRLKLMKRSITWMLLGLANYGYHINHWKREAPGRIGQLKASDLVDKGLKDLIQVHNLLSFRSLLVWPKRCQASIIKLI